MKKQFLPVAIVALLVCACGGKKSAETASADSSTVVSKPQPPPQLNLTGDVVCIYEGVPVYEAPDKKKWLAGISLGETVKYLNEESKDKDDKVEYIKVEMVDGKVGWAPPYGLVRDSKLGAIASELAIVYKRPQLAAISDKKFKMMEIVAVGKTEGEFLEVVGNKRTVTGWVKKGDITTNEDDVTTAVLAIKMIPADATGDVLEAKLKDFLAAAPSGSAFYNKISTQYNELVAAKEQGDPADTTKSN